MGMAMGMALSAAALWSGDAAPPAIVVDTEAGEVRVAAKFVNPAQVIEVFACDRTGPRHETVLEFNVTGRDLTRALTEIGCRGASYWNGTGPDAFAQNQGDRVLVLVRWEHHGEQHEHPAEGILTDGETGFPLLVRGFSFGARGAFKVEARDGVKPEGDEDSRKEDAGSDGVEISLGAKLRQTLPQSILAHPTSSVRMQRWMLAPFLDTRVVKDHRELVEKEVPVTLVLRRLRREGDLIEIARRSARRRGLAEADALYDRILPLAREIEALKTEYETLLEDLRKLITAVGSAASAEQVRQRILRGNWICARIEELYLTQYGHEEETKAAWVSRRPELSDEVREQAIDLARNGVRYEALLAQLRTAQAALDLPGFQGTPGEANLRRHLLSIDMEALELERHLAFTQANARYVDGRLHEARDDPYLRRLFQEDQARLQAFIHQLEAKRELARTEHEEVQGLLDGSWETRKAAVLSTRKRAEARLARARLEESRAELLQEIRYAESDLESNEPRRREEAGPKLQALRAKLAGLEAELKLAPAG